MADSAGVEARGLDARRAEALGATLPPLLAAAERIAATVSQGVHGRRRAGQGESFWQFRPLADGDTAARIDWRQSGKTDRAYVRETEREAAQTIFLWRDGSPAMQWKSRHATAAKLERAELLLLALASLLLRGGERVALLGSGERPVSGRAGLQRLAASLGSGGPDLPPDAPVPRHAHIVLFSDFLHPLPDIQATVGRLAGAPAVGHLVQVLDPAELDLPYSGRVRFTGLGREAHEVVPRVEAVRGAYARRVEAQQEGVGAICRAAGWSSGTHRTDHAPETALLALHQALA